LHFTLSSIIGGSLRFRRNLLKIASATFLAQCLGLAALPVLTRLYGPTEFGVFTTYTMMQGLLLAVVTARADWLIPNARSPARARALMGAGALSAAALLVVLALALWTFAPPLRALFRIPESSLFLYLLPFGVLFGAAQLLFQSWFIYRGDLGFVGWSKLAQAGVTLTISIALGLTSGTSNGLIIGYVAGFAGAALTLFAGSAPWPWRRMQRVHHSLLMVRAYGAQMASSSALGLVNILANMSIVFLILRFYGNDIVGWYGLVFRLATAPIGLISTALVQSFWSDAAALAKTDPEALRRFYLGAVKRLALLAIPFAAVFLCAQLYIPLLFGAEDWSGAGVLLMAVTPYLVGMIVFSPTTHLIVYGKPHWQLAADLISLIASAAAFSVVALSGAPPWQAILVSSFVLLAGYILRFHLHLLANAVHRRKTPLEREGR